MVFIILLNRASYRQAQGPEAGGSWYFVKAELNGMKDYRLLH